MQIVVIQQYDMDGFIPFGGEEQVSFVELRAGDRVSIPCP
jgi:hypothetical protein